MTDIEIANSSNKLDIKDIARKLNISDENLILYGNDKAKIPIEKGKLDGKLILVTAINPTPYGEGKTTVSIGLGDALNKLNKNVCITLREPSMGPVFGLKGGATGGGYSQIIPMEDINLHFTGDMHAITEATNLLASAIDNHIFRGNNLDIQKVVFRRCLDVNDRALRNIDLSNRKDSFSITAASEIMAILCLATDINDLKRRLGNIVIGYNEENKPVTARDLKADGSLTVLLKDALKPNLVQTLEHTPAIVHGGPFANIAHGCNSIIATKLGMKLADYTITEAGFGADLGAEKFINIKCKTAQIKPDAVVCIATMKALKYHGGVSKEEIKQENIEALEKGTKNLFKHIENLKNKFGLNVIVAINKYVDDSEKEIEFLRNKLEENNVEMSLVESWEHGGKGTIDLAEKVVNLCEKETKLNYTYDLSNSIEEKIEKICKEIYGAEGIEISSEALEKIKFIKDNGYDKMPICIAKTQYSFSDDSKNLECSEPFKIHVQDVILNAGAEFIVIITGKIFTMPGLPKVPAAENIDINSDGEIEGLF